MEMGVGMGMGMAVAVAAVVAMCVPGYTPIHGLGFFDDLGRWFVFIAWLTL